MSLKIKEGILNFKEKIMGFQKIKEDFLKNTADAISNLTQQINDFDKIASDNQYGLPLIKKSNQGNISKDRALELIHKEFLNSSQLSTPSLENIKSKIEILNKLENNSPFIPEDTVNIDFKELIQQINQSDDVEFFKKHIE